MGQLSVKRRFICMGQWIRTFSLFKNEFSSWPSIGVVPYCPAACDILLRGHHRMTLDGMILLVYPFCMELWIQLSELYFCFMVCERLCSWEWWVMQQGTLEQLVPVVGWLLMGWLLGWNPVLLMWYTGCRRRDGKREYACPLLNICHILRTVSEKVLPPPFQSWHCSMPGQLAKTSYYVIWWWKKKLIGCDWNLGGWSW